MRIKKIAKYMFGIFVFSVISINFFTQFVYAKDISTSDIKRVGHFKLENRQIQGGALTQKYFVFTDSQSGGGSNGLTTIRFVDRSTQKEVSTNNNLKNKNFKHASTLYNKWGSNYVQIIDATSGDYWCIDITGTPKLLSNTDKCGSMLRSSSLDKGSTQYYRQGWTKYGDVYLRAYSGNNNDNNRIEVYNKNRNWKENFDFPYEKPTCELEDVAVDGSTGEVYAMCWNHNRGSWADFYRIDASVFKNYIEPGADGGSSSSSSSSGSSDYSSKKPNPTPTYTPAESTYDGVVETTFFDDLQDDGEGCGVYTVLNLILTILTWGIGIAGVIGISYAGILYQTSKGNEAQTTKAKRRIYEIMIGLAVYAILWALASWLLPGGAFNTSNECSTVSMVKVITHDDTAHQ